MISPRICAISIAWSWCSYGKFLNATHVGNTKLFGLFGLNPGIQLWSRHVPQSGLKGESINVMCKASVFSLLSKKNHFPKLLFKVNMSPLSSWSKDLNHNFIAWMGGFGPTNFAIDNWSCNTTMRATNFSELTLNEIASFLTRNPLEFLSTLDGSTSPIFRLNGLNPSLPMWSLASAIIPVTASVMSESFCCASPTIQPPRSSYIGSNLVPPPFRTLSANVSMLFYHTTRQSHTSVFLPSDLLEISHA